mgnify:CR=1 FL=1
MRTEAEQKIYEYKKAWAKANAEKVRASRKKYEENNKELVDAYRNSDAFKKRAVERATAYNKANKEKRKINDYNNNNKKEDIDILHEWNPKNSENIIKNNNLQLIELTNENDINALLNKKLNENSNDNSNELIFININNNLYMK